MSAQVKVEGLREFQRGLRDMDKGLAKALRVALNGAADIVVTAARPRVARRSGRAASTVKAQSTQKAVRVSAGGNRAPYYPWLDFGGRVGPSRGVSRPWRKEGRYIYPAFHANRERFTEGLQTALVDTARSAGLEVE